MKTTAKLLALGAILSCAACATQAETGESDVEATDQQVSTATDLARVVEAHVHYQAREELRDALAAAGTALDASDVAVPGVLEMQHQFSLAAIRLEVPSWTVHPAAAGEGAWWDGDVQSLAITFPRWSLGEEGAEWRASEAAAEKTFRALVGAAETVKEEHGTRLTTRRSAKGSFACTKSERGGKTSHACTISGVTNVGGTGLFWQWQK